MPKKKQKARARSTPTPTRRRKPTRAFECYRHPRAILTVSSAVRNLKRKQKHEAKSKPVAHASVVCREGGCEWNSRHPTAIKASKEADRRGAATVEVLNGNILPPPVTLPGVKKPLGVVSLSPESEGTYLGSEEDDEEEDSGWVADPERDEWEDEEWKVGSDDDEDDEE